MRRSCDSHQHTFTHAWKSLIIFWIVIWFCHFSSMFFLHIFVALSGIWYKNSKMERRMCVCICKILIIFLPIFPFIYIIYVNFYYSDSVDTRISLRCWIFALGSKILRPILEIVSVILCILIYVSVRAYVCTLFVCSYFSRYINASSIPNGFQTFNKNL